MFVHLPGFNLQNAGEFGAFAAKWFLDNVLVTPQCLEFEKVRNSPTPLNLLDLTSYRDSQVYWPYLLYKKKVAPKHRARVLVL